MISRENWECVRLGWPRPPSLGQGSVSFAQLSVEYDIRRAVDSSPMKPVRRMLPTSLSVAYRKQFEETNARESTLGCKAVLHTILLTGI